MTSLRISESKKKICQFLGKDNCEQKIALDLGAGSGICSLAMLQSGIEQVISVDLDLTCIELIKKLRDKSGFDENRWKILPGSLIDDEFMSTLPQGNLVYSWGVLHHTGDMWKAFDLACNKIAPGGFAYFAIYNETGRRFSGSRLWRRIKFIYNRSPFIVRFGMEILYAARAIAGDIITGHNPYIFIKNYHKKRGMRWWVDIRDWLGGYPYEFAKVDAVFNRGKNHGLILENLRTPGGLACNEFLFRRRK